MKYIYSSISLLLFITNIACAQKQNSDLIRYGLKGKVKTMQQTIYAFSRKDGDDWIVTDTPFYTEKKYNFSNKGILESLEENHIDTKSKKENITVTRFHYRNGKIAGSEWYDSKGNKKGESNVKWINAHKYIDIVDDKDLQLKIESIHLVDDDFRNEDTWVKRYSYNGLEANIRTQYFYKDGLLNKQIVSDSLSGNNYNYEVAVLKKDTTDNSIETVMSIQPPNGMPAQLIFTKYSYYTD